MKTMKRTQALCLLCLLALLAALLLSACGDKRVQEDETDETVTEVILPIEQEEEEPVLPYINPLTGLGSETDMSASRPIAIMINNLKAAQPQLGVSQADIIYELPAEGGITRMLAVYQSVEGVGEIGTVRSARDYYVSLAAGLDAIFLHAGGSEGAYAAIRNWGVTALDCVNGPYEGTLFWRDAARRKSAGYEHSVLTSGEVISELLPTYSSLRLEHEEDYAAPFVFTQNEVSTDGQEAAEEISVRFSSYKTGDFIYDDTSGLYKVCQYGGAYTDGNNDTQVAVRNVLILTTKISVIDNEGRLSIALVGSGSGQYACGGYIRDITWKKDSNTGAMYFYELDGSQLELSPGRSYINVIGTGSAYSVTLY